jgi:hypothetical protein
MKVIKIAGEVIMAEETIKDFYMCPKCLEPALEPTPCPNCGGERLHCRPGDPDDPCRKPYTAMTDEHRSRAPIWWLCAIGALDPEKLKENRTDQS